MGDRHQGVYTAVHHVMHGRFALEWRLTAGLMDPAKRLFARHPVLGQGGLDARHDLNALLLRGREARSLPDAITAQNRTRGATQQFALLNLGELPRVGDAEEGLQRCRQRRGGSSRRVSGWRGGR